MKTLKTVTLLALMSAVAAPAIAETVMSTEKSRLYEADYAAVLADAGYDVGVAVYGQYDADYDVYLTDADLFQPVLGHHDADYEVHLNWSDFSEIQIASR